MERFSNDWTRRLVAGALAVTVVAAAQLASAQPAPAQPAAAQPAAAQPAGSSPHTHDGFLLRLAIGPGYASASEEVEGLEGSISGTGGMFSLDLGGSVSDDLVLHGRLSDYVLSDPTFSLEGESVESEETTFSHIFLGVGATFYATPSNVYISGVLGTARYTLETRGDSVETDWGLGFELDVGKEWWVSDNWGLGVAGRLGYSRADEEYIDASLGGPSVGLLFSATYH